MKSKKTTFSILFFLRLERKNNSGAPLMMRVTINGKSAKISLGIRVQPGDWDSKRSRCRLREHIEGKRINIFIENVISKCNRAFTTLQDEYDVVTAQMVVNALQGKGEGKHQGIIEIFQKQVDELEKLIGKNNSYTHWVKNRTGMNHLRDFLNKKDNVSDIPIGRFTHDHVVGFYNFLRTEKGHAHNSAVKCMSLVKKVTSRAFHSGWIKRDPFIGFSLGCKPVERPYLEQHEIESIMNYKPEKENLELIRDLFIFSCFTGLAYADVKSLKASEIVKTSDGVEWIKTKRTKTKTKANIPLLPIPKSIILKYANLDSLDAEDLIFTVYSNQKVNQYLKTIAKDVGIDKNVTFHIARHTFATTVTLQNGIPIETVSKMLGHTNIKTTQHYANVLDAKICKDMEILRKTHLRIA
jgi:site-specific recombinase XerD